MTILSGIRIVEIEAIGPGPFCGMLLADLGADVIAIERPHSPQPGNNHITRRGKRVISLDLKIPSERDQALALISKADGLIEGMRPGVMERLGLSPEICHATNPRLAYGRVTGWGQDGPLSQTAGHDLNYIALSGALWYASPAGEAPLTPPTLIGDVAGGALYLAIGLLATIMNARKTGQGDIVDAAIVDGSAHMMSLLLAAQASQLMQENRGHSALDGSHWYNTYQCQDGQYISVAPLEPKFYQILLNRLGLTADPQFQEQYNPQHWPALKSKLQSLFLTKTQQEWVTLFSDSDVCVAPVLSPKQAASHPHNAKRGLYFQSEESLQAAPAPQFAKHKNKKPHPPQKASFDTILADWS